MFRILIKNRYLNKKGLSMREIAYEEIVKNVRDIIIYSASNLPEDALAAMKSAYENEKKEY